jgi:hypothetical protein
MRFELADFTTKGVKNSVVDLKLARAIPSENDVIGRD